MKSTGFGPQFGKLAASLSSKFALVNHREVINELAESVDRSWVYYVSLVVAGVIALLGLLTDSVAVVIGAMLISPLMGPIISSSLAFTIGDLPLARRAFKTIAVSVALTIVVSAAVTFVSPLKEPTAEILARVRPNILDLLVAVLSGIVGAIALCTKRNYLITSTGVAVATAVIPPLSVTGYALGTWQPKLAVGGFLLFFTNFVAIILASDLVFFILGFRTTLVENVKYSLRTRYLIVGGLLTLISIPLVYTLTIDLARVKEKKRIERVLKRHLDRDQLSRLTGYTRRSHDSVTRIDASVNTVDFIDQPALQVVEQQLARELKKPVVLHLEQVVVASGKALQHQPEPELPGLSSRSPQQPGPLDVRGAMGQLAAQLESELAHALAPFPVSEVRLTFAGAGKPLLVSAELRRDYPVSDDERLILARQMEKAAELPVELAIAAKPLLPVLRADRDGELSAESVKDLDLVKQLPEGPERFRFQISSLPRNSRHAVALRRYLTTELAVPVRSLSVASVSPPPEGANLRILRN